MQNRVWLCEKIIEVAAQPVAEERKQYFSIHVAEQGHYADSENKHLKSSVKRHRCHPQLRTTTSVVINWDLESA